MDVVCPLVRRLCMVAALVTLSASALAADPPATESPGQIQLRRLGALKALADAASPDTPPDRNALITGLALQMVIADPALVPAGTAGLGSLPALRAVCGAAAQGAVQLVQMAQASDDPSGNLARMSVAVDRSAIMGMACTARQLDMQSRAILDRATAQTDPTELDGMRAMADTLPTNIAAILLGATLSDLNPASRDRTATDALPILGEAAAVMPPATKAAALDAVQRLLARPDADGHIDRTTRDALLAPLKGSACTASCRLLGAEGGGR